jgi:hypothetical protein
MFLRNAGTYQSHYNALTPFSSEDGVNKFLRNAGTPLPDYSTLAQFLSEEEGNIFLRNFGANLFQRTASIIIRR